MAAFQISEGDVAPVYAGAVIPRKTHATLTWQDAHCPRRLIEAHGKLYLSFVDLSLILLYFSVAYEFYVPPNPETRKFSYMKIRRVLPSKQNMFRRGNAYHPPDAGAELLEELLSYCSASISLHTPPPPSLQFLK